MKIENRVLTHVRTLQVLDAIRNGPRRFNDLQRAVHAPNPVQMSARLKKMVRDGLIIRTVVDFGPPAVVTYALTDVGRDLLGAATPLLAWVAKNQEGVAAHREMSRVRAAMAASA